MFALLALGVLPFHYFSLLTKPHVLRCVEDLGRSAKAEKRIGSVSWHRGLDRVPSVARTQIVNELKGTSDPILVVKRIQSCLMLTLMLTQPTCVAVVQATVVTLTVLGKVAMLRKCKTAYLILG